MRRVPMAFLAAALLAAKPAPAAPLIVQGSTTLSSLLMVPHQEDIEQLSGQKLVVVPNKSSLGLQALIERNAQLGMISGPLAVEVSALAKILPSSDLGKFRDFEIA